jgi:hypothetical protein
MSNVVWTGVALWFGLNVGFVAWRLYATRLVWASAVSPRLYLRSRY